LGLLGDSEKTTAISILSENGENVDDQQKGYGVRGTLIRSVQNAGDQQRKKVDGQQKLLGVADSLD